MVLGTGGYESSRLGNQFDPVAERIIDIGPLAPLNRAVLDHGAASLAQTGDQLGKYSHPQRRMGFAGGSEGRIDAEVDAQRAEFKPAPAVSRQFGRLGNFAQAKQASVRIPRGSSSTSRHRQLDVIDADQRKSGPCLAYFALLALLASIAGARGPTHKSISTVLETL